MLLVQEALTNIINIYIFFSHNELKSFSCNFFFSEFSVVNCNFFQNSEFKSLSTNSEFVSHSCNFFSQNFKFLSHSCNFDPRFLSLHTSIIYFRVYKKLYIFFNIFASLCLATVTFVRIVFSCITVTFFLRILTLYNISEL